MLICVMLICKFNEVVLLFDNIVVIVVFVDLLFVVMCFCMIEGFVNVVMVLMFCIGCVFVNVYGVDVMSGLLNGLIVCVVVVFDVQDKVIYVEFVGEIKDELNYDVVFVVLK